MNQALTTAQTQSNAELVETVIAKGDLGKLTTAERNQYYAEMCRSLGLNPLTRPFEYLVLQGKTVLYARRDAADQLRKINGISIEIVTKEIVDGILTVHVRAKDQTGRTDEDYGFANVTSLKGEAWGNALLKAVTKAKRRVTLSISGLGVLDETEVESIQGAVPQRSSNRLKNEGGDQVFQSIVDQVKGAETVPALQAVHKQHAMTIASWPNDWRASFETEIYDPKLAELQEAAKRRPRPTKSHAASEPSATGGVETNGTGATDTLSAEDSATLLKTLCSDIDLVQSQDDLRGWLRTPDTKLAIKTLTEDDYMKLSDKYEQRLGDLAP